MSDALTIRVAEAADIPGVLRIFAQPAVDAGETITAATAEALLENFSQYPSYYLYVGCLGADVVGTFALLIMDNLAHLGRPSAIIEDVAVDPQFQRRGIGRALVRFAMDKARAAGCYKLMLSAATHRREAHEFYESLGFSCQGYSFHLSLEGDESP